MFGSVAAQWLGPDMKNLTIGRRGDVTPGKFQLPAWTNGIIGAETGGYNAYGDIISITADGRDIRALWTEFQETLAIYNARRTALVGILTFPVTQLIEDVPVIGESQFEEASEYGLPQGVRPSLNYNSIAYDFKDYDVATRFTWKFLRDASAQQVEAVHQQILNADNKLLFRKVMEAIYDNRDRSTLINRTAYSVVPLYNADGVIPPPYKNTTFSGSHTHYLPNNGADAKIDSGDIMDLYNLIAEHGFGIEQGTQFVLLCNQAEINEIRKFRAGTVNNNSTTANYDFIPSASQPTIILPNAEGLLGSLPPSVWQGLPVVGSYADILIVHEDYIPAGYPVMLGSGGNGDLQNPVGLRQHANPAYQGLRLLPGNQQAYPLIDSYYSRGFGTGVRQRGGAAVLQVTTGTTYTAPSQYTKNGNNLG